jgi:hypothetical protein
LWQDPVGDLVSYLCEQWQWVNKVIAIAHNAKSFDLHFIINGTILLKWQHEIITNGMKIVCMKYEHMIFLDSISHIPLPLRKLPEVVGLPSSKSYYPHYFNTRENLDYIGPIPDKSYYGISGMSESERHDFLDWY